MIRLMTIHVQLPSNKFIFFTYRLASVTLSLLRLLKSVLHIGCTRLFVTYTCLTAQKENFYIIFCLGSSTCNKLAYCLFKVVQLEMFQCDIIMDSQLIPNGRKGDALC